MITLDRGLLSIIQNLKSDGNITYNFFNGIFPGLVPNFLINPLSMFDRCRKFYSTRVFFLLGPQFHCRNNILPLSQFIRNPSEKCRLIFNLSSLGKLRNFHWIRLLEYNKGKPLFIFILSLNKQFQPYILFWKCSIPWFSCHIFIIFRDCLLALIVVNGKFGTPLSLQRGGYHLGIIF